jgi:hypothetical protein
MYQPKDRMPKSSFNRKPLIYLVIRKIVNLSPEDIMQHKFTFLLSALLLFSLLITPVGRASALTNYVQDPSLEAAYGSTVIWKQSSINSDTPVCKSTVVDCTVATGAPRTGTVWAQFGGLDWSDPDVQSPELADLYQNVTFPNSCGASLQFYLWIGDAAGDANDVFNVLIDNVLVFSANATQQSTYPSYTLVTINVNSYANGAIHKVEFFSRQFKHSPSQTVTFNLDDISVVPTCFTISGNAGTAGATLNYTGGSTPADGSGNYSFTVPADWSGTVTPSKPTYVFSPPNRTYTAVAANQTAQDYTAFVGFTISGNVGLAGWSSGVTLSYMDGTPKTVTSQINGSYVLPVSAGWSGTVTPSHPCFNFTPANRPYTNVTTNKTNENYTATFNNSAPLCAVTAGVFRPSDGALYLKNSNTTGFADVAINYGIGGDYPIAGDWNGDGIDTIGVYRNGVFYLRNSNTIGFADIVFAFGLSGDQPIAGDWNGDGVDTIGVYRNGTFFLRNSNDTGPAEMIFALGIAGDVGIAGDWNHDGMDTVGVFRPSNGALYLKDTNSTGFADIQINYGLPGDKPVTGDWNGDGTDTIGVYRNGTFYLRNTNTVGFADIVFDLGIPGDMPIAGNWDGQP